MREAAEQLLGWMESPEVRSWLEPLDGPSRALGAAIRGENPVVAAGDREAGTFGEALQEYGVPAWLAGAAEFLVPDPTGARKVTDLIPMLSIIGPAGIRSLMSKQGMPRSPRELKGKSPVQFVPTEALEGAQGNYMRRAPEELAEFGAEIRRDPGGMVDPVVVDVNPTGKRFYVGEGNHRVAAMREAGEPVPAFGTTYFSPDLYTRSWDEKWMKPTPGYPQNTGPLGAPLPPRSGPVLPVKKMRWGDNLPRYTPSHVGLPTYSKEAVIEYALERGRSMNISQAELDELIGLIEKYYAPATRGPSLDHIPLPPGGF